LFLTKSARGWQKIRSWIWW